MEFSYKNGLSTCMENAEGEVGNQETRKISFPATSPQPALSEMPFSCQLVLTLFPSSLCSADGPSCCHESPIIGLTPNVLGQWNK